MQDFPQAKLYPIRRKGKIYLCSYARGDRSPKRGKQYEEGAGRSCCNMVVHRIMLKKERLCQACQVKSNDGDLCQRIPN